MKATRARKRNKAMQDHPSVYTQLPMYSGGTRDTYVGEDWVWKVPRHSMFRDGPEQNRLEAEMYRARKEGKEVSVPVAECYLLNNGVLKMRRVKTIYDLKKHPDAPDVAEKELPAWVYDIDSCQAGIDNHGEIVAYDV